MIKILLSFIFVANVLPIVLVNDVSLPWPFEMCLTGPVTINSCILNQKPAKGTDVEITANATSSEYIEFDHVQIVTTIRGIKINTRKVDFKTIVDVDDQFLYDYSTNIPKIAPSNQYKITVTFFDKQNEAKGCFFILFTL